MAAAQPLSGLSLRRSVHRGEIVTFRLFGMHRESMRDVQGGVCAGKDITRNHASEHRGVEAGAHFKRTQIVDAFLGEMLFHRIADSFDITRHGTNRTRFGMQEAEFRTAQHRYLMGQHGCFAIDGFLAMPFLSAFRRALSPSISAIIASVTASAIAGSIPSFSISGR